MNKLIGAMLLVTGTCIGAGMLALPVRTAGIGFFPIIFIFSIICLIMVTSALFLLEVTLWHDDETNLISMSKNTLGNFASKIMWFTYILFFYSVLSSYSSGGISIIKNNVLSQGVSNTTSALLFVIPFAFIIFLGSKIADLVNRIFVTGIIISYGSLLSLTVNADSVALPIWDNFYQTLYSMPIIVTAFGFHHLIPTLRRYLKSDVKKIIKAITLGAILPLVIYLAWEYVIFSSINLDKIIELLNGPQNPGDALINLFASQNPIVGTIVLYFSFFALVSSFVGVALGVFDFLSNGLNIEKNTKGRLILTFLTFAPPTIFSILYPTGFMLALSYASIFSVVLLILFPSLMVYFGRKKYTNKEKIIKNPYLPIIISIISLLIISIEFI